MKSDAVLLTIETAGPEETMEAGERLGRRLKGGEVIAMKGDLGSGKTTFIRGLARGLGVPEGEISSPTFVFAHEHRGRQPLAHIDLYRTEAPDDIQGIGLLDYFEGSWVVAVEWAEKGAAYFPEDTITIRFEPGEDPSRRRLTVSTGHPDREVYFGEWRERFCATRN
jgi:tRNA threonylcarbamoyladenosine biosynthesis protein TsaE